MGRGNGMRWNERETFYCFWPSHSTEQLSTAHLSKGSSQFSYLIWSLISICHD